MSKNILLHIHTGPGRHEEILIEELKKHKLSFSYSNHFPRYQFGVYEKGNLQLSDGSPLYDEFNKWIWRLKRLLPVLKNTKRHLDYTYPLYDYITRKRLRHCEVLFCWPQVSLYSMRYVKKKGGICILEYPIAHVLTWQRYLQEESKRYEIDLSQSFFSKATIKRMLQEIELADYISVPSTFVRNSFIEHGIHSSKILMNPYGIDTSFFYPKENKEHHSQPFTLIAIGTVELRKGVQYLLEAFQELALPKAELKILGIMTEHFKPVAAKYKSNPNIKFLGELDRRQTAIEMRSADVMVMPSLVEGLSLGILETMASGTPVISSENAGGLDVIDEGIDGFVFPIRDTSALKERIHWCYHNREKLVTMGLRARDKMADKYSTSKYGERAAKMFIPFLQKKNRDQIVI